MTMHLYEPFMATFRPTYVHTCRQGETTHCLSHFSCHHSNTSVTAFTTNINMSTPTSAPGSFTIAVPVNLTQSYGLRKGICFAQFYDHASGRAEPSNDGGLSNPGWTTTGSLQRMEKTPRGYSCRSGDIPGDQLQLSASKRGSLGASLPPVPNATFDRIRQRFPGIDTDNYSLSTMVVPV
jgi:hypothetical protein